MYSSQIIQDKKFSREGKKVSAELGFDIKAISGKIHIESHKIGGLVPLLNLTEKYIRENEQPKSPDSGASWVEGELGMKAVAIGSNKDVFALIGKYQRCTLLLVGSQKNSLLSEGEQKVDTRYSHFPVIEDKLLDMWLDVEGRSTDDELRLGIALSSDTGNATAGIDDYDLSANILEIHRMASRESVRVRFLARRLFHAQATRVKSEMTAIYSPLYVIQD